MLIRIPLASYGPIRSETKGSCVPTGFESDKKGNHHESPGIDLRRKATVPVSGALSSITTFGLLDGHIKGGGVGQHTTQQFMGQFHIPVC